MKYYIAANSTARHGNNTDLDSHADTCVAGSNFAPVGETYDTCTVYGFNGSKTKDVRIGSACTIYEAPDGTPHLLRFNHSLILPNQQPSLLCPNQMRLHDIEVNDVPTSLSPEGINIVYVYPCRIYTFH